MCNTFRQMAVCQTEEEKQTDAAYSFFTRLSASQPLPAAQERTASLSPGDTGVWHLLILYAGENEGKLSFSF